MALLYLAAQTRDQWLIYETEGQVGRYLRTIDGYVSRIHEGSEYTNTLQPHLLAQKILNGLTTQVVEQHGPKDRHIGTEANALGQRPTDDRGQHNDRDQHDWSEANIMGQRQHNGTETNTIAKPLENLL